MIRSAEKSDAVKISNLVASLSHFYLNNNATKLPNWFADTLELSEFVRRIESSNYTNLVCELNDEIVGYIAFKGQNHLFHLFVDESHQGKGISRKLWQSITSQCISDTYTLRSSLFAVPIYKKFGFVESAPESEKDGIGFQPMTINV